VLVASDLHYTLRQFDWLVGAAPEFDLVVLAGDQLDATSNVACDAQIAVVLEYLALIAARSRVIVSSGNHDLTGPDANGERAALWLAKARASGVYSDGDPLTVDDTLITTCPWWDGPVGRDSVAAQLATDARHRPACWVWVYHWPPIGSPTSWTGRRHYGDPDLAGWIEEHQPDIVICGHVHDPPFKPEGAWADRIGRTWIFNPGRQIGPTPTYIELDLSARRARWSSLLGSEEVDLDDAIAPPRTLV
jgi:Icc-related predicted phosphoesterase